MVKPPPTSGARLRSALEPADGEEPEPKRYKARLRDVLDQRQALEVVVAEDDRADLRAREELFDDRGRNDMAVTLALRFLRERLAP